MFILKRLYLTIYYYYYYYYYYCYIAQIKIPQRFYCVKCWFHSCPARSASAANMYIEVLTYNYI